MGAPQKKLHRPSELALYHDLFERMWDAAFLLDPATLAILDSNLAAERITGKNSEEISQCSFLDFVPKTEAEMVQKSVRMAKRKYYPYRFDCSWKLPEREVLGKMSIQACLLKIGGQTGQDEVLQVIAQDVTLLFEAQQKEKEYQQKLIELSIHDEMTSLANYRHFIRELGLEHERGQRYGTPYAIIFCDIDFFKKFNDRHGHAAGDQVLKDVAKVLKDQSRNTDLVARYGGEEFVVLCRGVNSEGAMIFAERLRSKVESLCKSYGGVTISAGVAGFPQSGDTQEKILEQADQALYASKKAGRNRISCLEEVSKKISQKKTQKKS